MRPTANETFPLKSRFLYRHVKRALAGRTVDVFSTFLPD